MLYQDQNDETLVMLTLAGEQRAYEVLVVRYQRAVVASAAMVTRSEFMAEDAAQDAFVTAWMKLNTLKEPQKFGSWVCRIAKNCALNMLMRYRSFLPLDTVIDQAAYCDPSHDPAELYALSEEKDELYASIGKLPEKVKTIIYLHYFEGLSIAEIADRMRISPGTVKWQLHDGRKRIRKELCAMNEKYSDTLVQRVMKKVEELKLWQVKNDKSGFEVIYADVLREVEDLPESGDKYHALADVLMRGWWWLPGEKNDALFARIKDAAIKGKNDEVMEFIVTREDSRAYGKAKIDFIRDKQIPMLEEAGFVRALAREWFWLGYHYFRDGQTEKGYEAYDRVQRILKPSDTYYTLVPHARKIEEKLGAEFKGVSERSYLIDADATELRYMDGELRYWSENAIGEGTMYACDRYVRDIFRNSSRCDGRFFADLQLGQTYTGTDGSTLCYVSERETVETPCGTFEGCHLLTIRHRDFNGISEYKSYYKSGVGIVKHAHTAEGITDIRLLKSYHIAGGEGLLPLAADNTWEYTDEYPADVMRTELRFTVSYADDSSVIVSSFNCMERLKYDENSWLDMIEKIRNEYWQYKDGKQTISDVSDAIERANALAKTPMEKAHPRPQAR